MKKHTIIILLCLSIAGCSSSFVYRNIDWLVHWYLDDYIELNAKQEEEFDQAMARWLKWHQKQELDAYVQQLEDIKSVALSRAVDQQIIEAHQERLTQHWHRVRAYAVPDLVAIALTLEDEQITYLFAQLNRENRERAEEIAENNEQSKQQRDKKRLKRARRFAEEWLGDLSVSQVNMIQTLLVDRLSDNSVQWLRYQEDYQNALRLAFATRTQNPEFASTLSELLLAPEQYRSTELVQAHQQNRSIFADFLLQFAPSFSDKQIAHLVVEIEQWQQDILALKK